LLAQAGIKRVVFRHPYYNAQNHQFNSGMEWVHYKNRCNCGKESTKQMKFGKNTMAICDECAENLLEILEKE
jgi:hypothetical protein